MSYSTLQEQARMCQPSSLEEAKAKPPKVGDIVRYVGAQKPKLAGMEGEVTKIEKSADWYDKVYVTWAGKGDLKEPYLAPDVKVIRGYSKRFKGTPRLKEDTSDGFVWSGIGCDVCGYGSVENVDIYDPTQPCPDCGITMVTGPHDLSEGLLDTLGKTLLKFNLKHWDMVPGPIKALYKLLYGKKGEKEPTSPAKAVAAINQKLAQAAKTGKKPVAKGGIIIMQSMNEQRRLAGIEESPEPLVEDDNIGRTILQQMGGAGRIKAMTGGGPFVLLPKGVSFKFPNKKRTRGNYVEINLRGDDTYDMEFFNLSVKGKKSVKKYTMIYNDQLISIFEDQTGLYLRL